MQYFALLFFATLLFATASETNASRTVNNISTVHKQHQTDKKSDGNHTRALLEEKIKEQMEREKKFAKEQKFYQGKDYNLSEHAVDPKTLKDIPVIEPDYDFDITDVYRDDI